MSGLDATLSVLLDPYYAGIWERKRLELVADLASATEAIELAYDRVIEHQSTSYCHPNRFTRAYFAASGLLRVPVPCRDEVDIKQAISLRKRLRDAKRHEARCKDLLVDHLRYRPLAR